MDGTGPWLLSTIGLHSRPVPSFPPIPSLKKTCNALNNRYMFLVGEVLFERTLKATPLYGDGNDNLSRRVHLHLLAPPDRLFHTTPQSPNATYPCRHLHAGREMSSIVRLRTTAKIYNSSQTSDRSILSKSATYIVYIVGNPTVISR